MTAVRNPFRRREAREERALAGKAFRGVGLRIALVVLLASLFSYWQLYRALKHGLEEQLTSHMNQRARHESSSFEELMERHKLLRNEFIERYRRILSDPAAKAETLAAFERCFEVRPDGRVNVKKEFFDPPPDAVSAQPRWLSGGIDKTVPLTEDSRIRHALGFKMLTEHGPGIAKYPEEKSDRPFVDLYFQAPEESVVMYWPERRWEPFKTSDFRIPGHSYFDLGLPENNPGRKSRWTHVYFDEIAQAWLVSCITPVDVDNRHAGTFGTDEEMTSLIARIAEPGLPGTHTVVFDDSGIMIADSELADRIKEKGGKFQIESDGDEPRRAMLQLVRNNNGKATVIDDPAHDRLLAVGRISGADWNLVSIWPRSLLTTPAWRSALLVLGVGALSLLILHRVLKTQVSVPFCSFVDATERVTRGEERHLPTGRRDELGHLARSFESMTQRLSDARSALDERMAELHRVSERLQLATNAANIGIWDWDVTRDSLIWDDAMYQLYGITKEKFRGAYEAWTGTLAPEDLEKANAEIQAALRGEREFTTEFRVVWPDGSVHYIAAQSETFRDADGKPLRMVGVNYDITVRKLAEQKLVESRQLLAAVLDHYPGMIFWKDRKSVFLGCNRACALNAGLSDPSDIVGKTDDELIWDKDEVEGYLTDDREVIASGNAKLGIIEKQHQANGQLSWFETNKLPLKDSDGNIIGVMGTATDITRRIRAEEELRKLNATLESRIAERTRELEAARAMAESASQAKSAFLAAMSHEIRTPMNAVMNMIGTVLESSLDPQQHEYLKVAEGSASHLLTVINDILDFSKIESGKLEIEDIPYSLHALLEGVADLFRPKMMETKVEMILDVAPGTPDGLRGDPTRVRQILVNLMSNAFKFTPKGQVILSCVESSGRLRIAVADTGIGITKDHHAMLFKPFSQLDSSIARKFGGTGLGLTISRRLAQLMSGDISVFSVVGEGSIFTVDLPLNTDPSGNRHEMRPPVAIDGHHVLLIEDNAASRETVCALLKEHGLRCVAFSSAEEALEWMQLPEASDVGAAFVDWQLGEDVMDGVDGIAELKKLRAELPCFLISAFADHAVQERARIAGAAEFVQKPVNWSGAAAALREAFEVKTPEAVSEPAAVVEPLAGTTALLAEDNPQNQLVARILLKKLGISVDIAGNGKLAVGMARDHPDKYQVILMDVQMPEMDGLEATRQIRAMKEVRSIPIIAMTASAMTSDVEACMAAGMDGFVPKPIDRSRLLSEIARVLHRA